MTKKVFISYRRKTWGITHRVADDLRNRLDAEIFVDVDGVDQVDFEHAIINHLRSSQVVALIVSEYTFTDHIHRADDWVRRELVEALKLGIPIVLVSIDGQLPPLGLPEDIRDISRSQAINFYPDYFVPACQRLADFLATVADIPIKQSTLPSTQIPSSSPTVAQRAEQTTLEEAIRLLDSDEIEQLERAVLLLEELQKIGIKSRINIPAILDEARHDLSNAKHQQHAATMLNEIRILASSKRTLDEARNLYAQFAPIFPDARLDEDLKEKLKPTPSPRIEVISQSSQSRILKLGAARIDPKGVPQIYVPVGHYLMGSDPKQDKRAQIDEQPQHEIRIPQGFWLDQYPVTNAFFKAFTEDNGYRVDRWWSANGLKWRREHKVQGPEDYPNFTENLLQPRVGINWYEAEAYANWRGGRMPTEAEWEYAARGEKSLIYPWGNLYDQQCVNSGKRIGKTTSVDIYLHGKSWCGAFDMCGNVWEWCVDNYVEDFYTYCVKNKRVNNPLCSTNTTYRVMRGGSWRDTPQSCRAAIRGYDLLIRGAVWGCRVVIAATPLE